jgi:hypothetical protein
MRGSIATLLLSALIVAGCQPEPSAPTNYPTATGCKPAAASASLTGGLELTEAPRKVSFNQDIMPMLSASGGTRDYKCLGCHPVWKDPKEISNDKDFDRIIGSIKSGRMPQSGARVTAEDLATLDAWRAGGYLVDRPVDAPKTATDSGTSTSSGAGTAKAPCAN